MVTPLSPSATPSVIPPLSTGPGTGGTGGTPGNPAGTRTPAPETEWKGIEVRADALGLLVVDAEGQAGQAGLLAGDVINSINGIATGDERAFADATVNGTLPQGVVVATRAGERLAFELRSPATNTGNGNAATTTQSAAGIGAAPGGGVPGF